MSQFFARDFTQDRWRKAALKNAYSLLGKQRFDHAAAFFLLAGSLWDAIQVPISSLTDFNQTHSQRLLLSFFVRVLMYKFGQILFG